jgi:hypothetical protein
VYLRDSGEDQLAMAGLDVLAPLNQAVDDI